jgi:hypothetical protein
VEDAIDKFRTESNIKGRRVEMGCRSVGMMERLCRVTWCMLRMTLGGKSSSTWESLAVLVRAAALYWTERELGLRVERATVKGAQRLCRMQPHYSTSALYTCQCVQPCYSAG